MSRTPHKDKREIPIVVVSSDSEDMKIRNKLGKQLVFPTDKRLRSETRKTSPDEYKPVTPLRGGNISRRENNNLQLPQLQRKRSKSSSLANDHSGPKNSSRSRLESPLSFIREQRAPITRSRSPFIDSSKKGTLDSYYSTIKKSDDSKKRKLSTGDDNSVPRQLQKIRDNNGKGSGNYIIFL